MGYGLDDRSFARKKSWWEAPLEAGNEAYKGVNKVVGGVIGAVSPTARAASVSRPIENPNESRQGMLDQMQKRRDRMTKIEQDK
jgi:hypothetical protein